MSLYVDPESKTWVVQVARTAPGGKRLRRCQRVRGSRADAVALEKDLAADLDSEVAGLRAAKRREGERKAAAALLGIDPTSTTSSGAGRPPLLRDYLTTRWARQAAITQGPTTRRTTRTHVAYASLYLGDQRLDEIDQAAVARMREGLLRDGPASFTLNKNGEARRPRTKTFAPLAVNRIMATLAAALRLAERERVIDRAPEVDLLPADDSAPLVPPSEEELQAILKAAEDFRDVAPFMAEAVELAAETGMRAGEQFTRTWRFIDFSMGETGAIRIEKQPRVKLVDGRPWRPKHCKARIVPLSPRAREILLDLRKRVPSGADDPVLPARGGAPYVRLEAAPDKAGKGFFPDVVEQAAPGAHVRWHDLRHYFAVRALLRGVPIAVVSSWLGHSDINLTVKRYGRWAAEAREQWQWIKRMNDPINAVRARAPLALVDDRGDR